MPEVDIVLATRRQSIARVVRRAPRERRVTAVIRLHFLVVLEPAASEHDALLRLDEEGRFALLRLDADRFASLVEHEIGEGRLEQRRNARLASYHLEHRRPDPSVTQPFGRNERVGIAHRRSGFRSGVLAGVVRLRLDLELVQQPIGVLFRAADIGLDHGIVESDEVVIAGDLLEVGNAFGGLFRRPDGLGACAAIAACVLFGSFFDKNDLAARLRSLMSGCQTGEARSDHHHVGFLIPRTLVACRSARAPLGRASRKHAARADRAEGERAGEKATPR